MKITRHLLLAVALATYGSSYAQVFFSNGATVHLSTGAIVITNGGTTLAGASAFTNDGSIQITKDATSPFPGTFTIGATSGVGGNGTYRVEQDWINDGVFSGNNSTVELFGNTQQFITSTNGTATTFNNLSLTGVGVGTANRKKTLQGVDAGTGTTGNLAINDRELETQTQIFTVLNPAPGAVTNSVIAGAEGFVSSLAPGTLVRETNSATAYLFPTGSSLGTLRYRPIEVVPNNTSAATYTVRMNNADPTTDGFDRGQNDGSMCILNDLFYHSIARTAGTTPSDIRMFYIGASDGTWANMGHWRTTTNLWNDMSTMTLGTSGGFSTVTRAAWNFVNPGDPYVLTNLRPAQPAIVCPAICDNSTGNVFTLTGTAGNYFWTVPANGTITSGQGTDNITVDWATGTNYVYVYAVGTGGCNSLPDSCLPTVLPPPVANFTYEADGNYGDQYNFIDQSTGASIWGWNFGDGGTSTSQNPSYQYTAGGEYQVILTVSNAGGCTDTAMVVLNPGEGIVIPNVFSPNGDGYNDEYYIMSSGLTEYSLQVFNRWGQLMFESTDPAKRWDGKYNSKLCLDGTYYFVLKALSRNRDYSTTGTITITGTEK